MISRSFIVAGGLFLLFNLALMFPPARDAYHDTVQSQWQGNVIFAQEYPFETHRKRGVLVGSSLAVRIFKPALAENFYNLSLAGDGPFTGLEVVRRSGLQPDVVLIETNQLLQQENKEVLSNVFRPIFSDLRVKLPGLRERYAPANLVTGAIGARFVRLAVRTFEAISPSLPERPAESKTPGLADAESVFERQLRHQKSLYQASPDLTVIEQQIQKLKTNVADLKQRGARCVFVEMPIDHSLSELPRATVVRKALIEAFPTSQYQWIMPDDNRRYVTTDGIHLTDSEGEAYALYVQSELYRVGLIAFGKENDSRLP